MCLRIQFSTHIQGISIPISSIPAFPFTNNPSIHFSSLHLTIQSHPLPSSKSSISCSSFYQLIHPLLIPATSPSSPSSFLLKTIHPFLFPLPKPFIPYFSLQQTLHSILLSPIKLSTKKYNTFFFISLAPFPFSPFFSFFQFVILFLNFFDGHTICPEVSLAYNYGLP